jgi:hypothetical protein
MGSYREVKDLNEVNPEKDSDFRFNHAMYIRDHQAKLFYEKLFSTPLAGVFVSINAQGESAEATFDKNPQIRLNGDSVVLFKANGEQIVINTSDYCFITLYNKQEPGNPHAVTTPQMPAGTVGKYYSLPSDRPRKIHVEQFIPMFVDQGVRERVQAYVDTVDEVEGLAFVKCHAQAEDHDHFAIVIDERDGVCYTTLFSVLTNGNQITVGWINHADRASLEAKYPFLGLPAGNN